MKLAHRSVFLLTFNSKPYMETNFGAGGIIGRSQSKWGALYFFPVLYFILFTHVCSFMVVLGLGFWGWGLGLGFWGWDFQLMGFGACGVGPSWFCWG